MIIRIGTNITSYTRNTYKAFSLILRDFGVFWSIYLRLATGISFVRLFEMSCDNFHKLFSVYFFKFSNIAYENSS
jgi:hypothetical protein